MMGYSRQWVARPKSAPAAAVLHTDGPPKCAPGYIIDGISGLQRKPLQGGGSVCTACSQAHHWE